MSCNIATIIDRLIIKNVSLVIRMTNCNDCWTNGITRDFQNTNFKVLYVYKLVRAGADIVAKKIRVNFFICMLQVFYYQENKTLRRNRPNCSSKHMLPCVQTHKFYEATMLSMSTSYCSLETAS